MLHRTNNASRKERNNDGRKERKGSAAARATDNGKDKQRSNRKAGPRRIGCSRR
jgi:hypothetical protein